jgi:tripeptidyl-peptidase-1
MRLQLIALTALLASGLASPMSGYVVHEKRIVTSARRWVKRDKLESSVVLPMRIGLTQRNLHRADEYLLDVSDPQSPNYGRHWSVDKIAQTFAPSQNSVKAVQKWLVDAGIDADHHAMLGGRSWIQFNASVGEVERLLAAEYFVYEHEDSGDLNVACDAYSVPSLMREHIDLITPTVHFNTKLGSRRVPRTRRSSGGSVLRRQGQLSPRTSLQNASDHTQCVGNAAMLPSCIRALYGVPDEDLLIQAPNSLGITGYSEWFRQSDLDTFTNYTRGIVGKAPIAISIDGGNASTLLYIPPTTDGYLTEPDLDLEYATSLTYPLNITFFGTGDYIKIGTPDLFLDAIDGSFCDYDGGDDPNLDPQYPDTYNQPGAYNHTRECGTIGDAITNVISNSHDNNEELFTAHYMNRQCYEYMKLGLRGVTVINSSGDGGVNGHSLCQFPDESISAFRVGYPPSCPYLTSVGATMIRPNASATDARAEVSAELMDDQHQFKSTGGFSSLFPIPPYQRAALATYWEQHAPNVSASVTWNNSETTRGIPDVAFNGINYVTAIKGVFENVSGTSASAPAFAALIARVNQARLNAGKGTVGFINPVLYANPQVFQDITEGGNKCAGQGFSAVEGWDPVTGLGTPKFKELLDLFLLLP